VATTHEWVEAMADDQQHNSDATPAVPRRKRGRPPVGAVSTVEQSAIALRGWADGVLAEHGLSRGETGHDVDALRALAEARGWGHATEEHLQRRRERRWRATVFRLDAPGAQAWVTGGATGNAAIEADALAIALARMLARPAREAGT
jgi:hypothetical protein